MAKYWPPPKLLTGRLVKKSPAGCVVSRVLSRRRPGRGGRRRRPFIWTRPHGRALPLQAPKRPLGKAAYPRLRFEPHLLGRVAPVETSLLGLAPGGVYHAGRVTSAAVRSYRTFSPLPLDCFRRRGRFIFCGTFPIRKRRVAWRPTKANGGCCPPPWFNGARTFLPPSTSDGERPSTHPANKIISQLTTERRDKKPPSRA